MLTNNFISLLKTNVNQFSSITIGPDLEDWENFIHFSKYTKLYRENLNDLINYYKNYGLFQIDLKNGGSISQIEEQTKFNVVDASSGICFFNFLNLLSWENTYNYMTNIYREFTPVNEEGSSLFMTCPKNMESFNFKTVDDFTYDLKNFYLEQKEEAIEKYFANNLFSLLIGNGTTPSSPEDIDLENIINNYKIEAAGFSPYEKNYNGLLCSYFKKILNISNDPIIISEIGLYMNIFPILLGLHDYSDKIENQNVYFKKFFKQYFLGSWGDGFFKDKEEVKINCSILLAREVLKEPIVLMPGESQNIIMNIGV